MKLKLTIALVILALVLGMVLVSCDDGDVPVITEGTRNIGGTDYPVDLILDKYYVPYIDGNLKPETGAITGFTGDTTAKDSDGNYVLTKHDFPVYVDPTE